MGKSMQSLGKYLRTTTMKAHDLRVLILGSDFILGYYNVLNCSYIIISLPFFNTDERTPYNLFPTKIGIIESWQPIA